MSIMHFIPPGGSEKTEKGKPLSGAAAHIVPFALGKSDQDGVQVRDLPSKPCEVI